MRDLLGRQRLGNHPDSPAAGVEHCVRHDSHQPHSAPAIDQAEAVLCDRPADAGGRISKSRIRSERRAAVNTKVLFHDFKAASRHRNSSLRSDLNSRGAGTLREVGSTGGRR